MTLWINDTRRWLLLAFAAGAWWAGWLWFLLETTRGLPGILSGLPGRGAFEWVEAWAGRPWWVVVLALFLSGALPVLALGLLRGALDPARRAIAALRWPLRSPGFVLAGLIWSALSALCVALAESNSKYLFGLIVAGFLAAYLTPFAAWNTEVLDAARPTRWWRPRWPGLRTVALYTVWLTAGWIFEGPGKYMAMGFFMVMDLLPPWAILPLIDIADFSLDVYLAVALIVVWLNRARWQGVHDDFGRLWRGGIVGELMWVCLFFAALALLALLAPVALVGGWALFIVPGYRALLADGLPPMMHLMVLLAEYFSKYWYLPVYGLALPAGFYLNLALGRMVRSHQTGAA